MTDVGVVTLPQHVLAVLGESPVPVTTPDLVALCACDKSHARARVLTALYRLLESGLVARGPPAIVSVEFRASRRRRAHSQLCRVKTWTLA